MTALKKLTESKCSASDLWGKVYFKSILGTSYRNVRLTLRCVFFNVPCILCSF